MSLQLATIAAESIDVTDRRCVIHESQTVLIEDFAASAQRAGQGHSERCQIVLPYLGAFKWMVGREVHLLDANTTLFVEGGQDYVEAHPLLHVGHASLILTPDDALLDELCAGRAPRDHHAFSATTGILDHATRFAAHRLRVAHKLKALEADEITVRLLGRVLRSALRGGTPRPSIISRAKEVIHSRGFEPLSLTSIAREVGVSPAYLTQAFTRFEGVPLYRYQMRLRLSQALLELPSRKSLTELALDLGFSSHAHFTAAFRSAFGLTPSQYRAEARGGSSSPLH